MGRAEPRVGGSDEAPAASTIEMQDSSMQQRMRSAQVWPKPPGLLEMSKNVLDPKELETIQRLIAELQSELERNSSLRNLQNVREGVDLLEERLGTSRRDAAIN